MTTDDALDAAIECERHAERYRLAGDYVTSQTLIAAARTLTSALPQTSYRLVRPINAAAPHHRFLRTPRTPQPARRAA